MWTFAELHPGLNSIPFGSYSSFSTSVLNAHWVFNRFGLMLLWSIISEWQIEIDGKRIRWDFCRDFFHRSKKKSMHEHIFKACGHDVKQSDTYCWINGGKYSLTCLFSVINIYSMAFYSNFRLPKHLFNRKRSGSDIPTKHHFHTLHTYSANHCKLEIMTNVFGSPEGYQAGVCQKIVM